MNAVLYFYRWNACYMECAKRSGRIVIPYTCLKEKWKENRQNFLELRQAGVKIFAAFPGIGTGFHDEEIRSWAEELRKIIRGQVGNGIEEKEESDGNQMQKMGRKAAFKNQTERCNEGTAFLPDGIYIGNQGQVEMLRGLPMEIFGDEGLNVFNCNSLDFWRQLGLSGNVLSYELEPEDWEAFFSEKMSTVEVLIYGRIPVMVSEYCPIAGGLGIEKKHCGACKGKKHVVLASERGERYPVLMDSNSCQTILLSAKPVDRRGAFVNIMDKIFRATKVDLAENRWRLSEFSSEGKFPSSCLCRICIFDEPASKIMKMLDAIEQRGNRNMKS